MNPTTPRIGVLRWAPTRRERQRKAAEHRRQLQAFVDRHRREVARWSEPTVTKIGFWAKVHQWLT